MKKFKFSLAAVLEFKELVLEEKKKELALAVRAVTDKEREIRVLEADCSSVVGEFNQKKSDGMTVIDAQSYGSHIRVLQKNIDDQYSALEKLRKTETEKSAEVVFAKQEVSSLEKLRDQKIEEYNRAAAKEEELAIEELVSNRMVSVAAEA